MNHVMALAKDDVRTRQLTDTRKRIARAVAEIILSDGPASVSFPAVADRSGVSLRTVYRHFPNKEALLAAAVDAGSERTISAVPLGERTIAGMREFLRELWVELEENRDLIAVQLTTPAGQGLRATRLRNRHAEFRTALPREVPGLPDEDNDRLAALCTVVMSSHLMLEMVDVLGVDRDTAAELVAYALESVCERARREGEVR
jgi:AcrR family transcriptional regulator